MRCCWGRPATGASSVAWLASARSTRTDVNLAKTKVVLLAGADSEEDALQRVQSARLTYGGGMLEAAPEFKYLGVVFHCCRPIGESAAPARAGVARLAAALFEGRCAELGLEATRLLLILYSTFVDSTLSYAAAVWAPGLALAAARRPVVGACGLSAAELQHHRNLRRLLGLPSRTPTATVLAEAGQPPLHIRWLVQAARCWSSLVAAPAGSLMHAVLEGGLQLAAAHSDAPLAHLPWVAQLQRALEAAGVPFDPQQREQLRPDAVQQAAMQHYLQRVAEAAERPGASRLRHYFCSVRPSCLSTDGYCLPSYISQIMVELKNSGAVEELYANNVAIDSSCQQRDSVSAEASAITFNQVPGLWILLAAGVAAAAAALLVRWLLRRGVRRAKRAAVVQRSLTKLHAMGSSSSFQRLRRLASGHRADSGKLGCDGSDCSQPDGCGDGKLAECDVEQALGRSDSSAAGAEGDCREAVAAAVAELLATAARVQRLMGQPPAKQA